MMFVRKALFAAGALALASLSPRAAAQNLTDAQLSLVSAQLEKLAKLSWELGTRAQAILELNASSFSVFSSNSLPPPTAVSNSGSALAPVFDIAQKIVAGRAASNKNATGPQPLVNDDGSAADPASIGVAVLLANWTGQSGEDYAGAARDQYDFLYSGVPMTSDGAISHRFSEVQLWSDFVYMVPPFLAYYGVLQDNQTIVEQAYTQIKLYRNYLRDPNANNLWKHILLGSSGNDEGHWSTGNGWAAAGILRVLATIMHSQFNKKMKNEQKDLANWVNEIHTGMYLHQDSTGLFTNYADQPANVSGSFYDGSSTALLASTVYRLAVLWGTHAHLPAAERARTALSATNGSELAHFTPAGLLRPVVNPSDIGREGNASAEGQAFVVEMQAAWADWVAAGSQGASGAAQVRVAWALVALAVALALVF